MPGFINTNDKVKTKYLELLKTNMELLKSKKNLENNLKKRSI